MTNSARTRQLLRYVARRLSGREDCKKIQFRIGIGIRPPESQKITESVISDSAYIFFYPMTYVYTDVYHRKDIDYHSIEDHIIRKYYPELILGYDNFGNIRVDTSKFVRGVYEYQLSMNGKRRRWVRRNEFVIDDNKRIIHNFVTYKRSEDQ